MRSRGFTDPLALTEARAGSLIDSLSGRRTIRTEGSDSHTQTYINTRRKHVSQ